MIRCVAFWRILQKERQMKQEIDWHPAWKLKWHYFIFSTGGSTWSEHLCDLSQRKSNYIFSQKNNSCLPKNLLSLKLLNTLKQTEKAFAVQVCWPWNLRGDRKISFLETSCLSRRTCDIEMLQVDAAGHDLEHSDVGDVGAALALELSQLRTPPRDRVQALIRQLLTPAKPEVKK